MHKIYVPIGLLLICFFVGQWNLFGVCITFSLVLYSSLCLSSFSFNESGLYVAKTSITSLNSSIIVNFANEILNYKTFTVLCIYVPILFFIVFWTRAIPSTMAIFTFTGDGNVKLSSQSFGLPVHININFGAKRALIYSQWKFVVILTAFFWSMSLVKAARRLYRFSVSFISIVSSCMDLWRVSFLLTDMYILLFCFWLVTKACSWCLHWYVHQQNLHKVFSQFHQCLSPVEHACL